MSAEKRKVQSKGYLKSGGEEVSLTFYFFLAVLRLCRCAGFSLAVVSGGHSPVAVPWLLLWSTGSRVHGLQKLQLMGFVVTAPGL